MIQQIEILQHDCRVKHVRNTSRPTMIFLMGSMQDIEGVDKLSEEFSKEFDYHCLELPGTGRTKALPAHMPVSYLAECLDTYIRQESLDQIYLVACSYSTGVGLEYAKMQRNRLTRMGLIGSMGNIPLNDWPTMLKLMHFINEDTDKFADGFIDLLTSTEVNNKKHPAIIRAARRKAHQSSESVWNFIHNTLRLMTYEPLNLNNIEIPTLVMTGEFDPYVKPEYSQQLAEKIPNSQFLTIPNCDHLFHIEDPELTVKNIIDFYFYSQKVMQAA